MYTMYMFSYWIFIWYVLYILNILPYNPKSWIMIAIFMSIYNIICMIGYKYYYMLFLFIILLTILKFIPLYTLLYTPYKNCDFFFGCFLFSIYVLWLSYHRINVIHLIYSFYFSDVYIKDNDVSTSHFMTILDSFIKKM